MPQEDLLAKGLVEKVGEEKSFLTHEYEGSKFESKVAVADHEEGMKLIMKTLTDGKAGVIGSINEIESVGHRVVHGGEKFSGSMKITPDVLKAIEDYEDLAPLHNPPNLAGIRAIESVLPGVIQVAAFDTAFHQTIPEIAYMYAIPCELYEKYKIRRYGFHGTSHRFVARRAAELLGKSKEEANIITCHLGNGCSMAAVKEGKSVDTSMGFTPLEGLVMGTRSGDIDPAIIFYLEERRGMSTAEINTLLNKKSGLLGVSGVSNDMRTVIEEAGKGNKRAALAVDIFCYRIKKYIGAYTAVLGRVDAVVFTGGIGENSVPVREKVLEGLECLGIKPDSERNCDESKKERVITSEDSAVKVFVIPTNEEVRIACDTYEMTVHS
jgi:acetate kinase